MEMEASRRAMRAAAKLSNKKNKRYELRKEKKRVCTREGIIRVNDVGTMAQWLGQEQVG